MSCWPLIERELIQALRRGRAVQRRFFTAAIAAGVTALYILMQPAVVHPSARSLHVILFVLGLYIAVFEAGEIASGLFMHERQNGTFGLLFLTGLSAGEVFVGKLFGVVAIVVSRLCAIVPVVAVPFFMGGVSMDLFLASVIALPVLMLLTLGASVLASTISRDAGQAFSLVVMMIATIAGVPLLLEAGNGYFGARIAANLSAFSPVYAPFLIIRGLSPNYVTACWQSLGVSCVWAIVFLAGSVLTMKHQWRVQVAGRRDSRWQTAVRKLLYGSAEWRRRLRVSVLDLNPVTWLVMQERRAVVYTVLSLVMFTLLWLVGWWLWPAGWLNATLFLLEAVVLTFIYSAHVRHASGRLLMESRRDGTLELVLTTPLHIPEVVDGLQDAIRSQFAPVTRIYAGVFALLMLGGVLTRDWTFGAMTEYVVLWAWLIYAIFRTGRGDATRTMWIAMNTGRLGFSNWRHLRGNRIWFVYMMFQFYRVAANWSSTGTIRFTFPTGSTAEMVIVFFASIVVFIFIAAIEASPPLSELKTKLIFHFREIAMEPVPDGNDPRLREWDPNQNSRLPSAWRANPAIKKG